MKEQGGMREMGQASGAGPFFSEVFYLQNLVASATNVLVWSGPQTAYARGAPELTRTVDLVGFAVRLQDNSTQTVGAGTLTVKLQKSSDGAAWSDVVSLAIPVGGFRNASTYAAGSYRFRAGSIIRCVYSTNASYSPATNDLVARADFQAVS